MTFTRPLTILVIGSGAIGGFYSANLARAGATVSVVSRSDYDAVCQNGIMIKSPLGDFTFQPKRVLHHANEYDGHPDIILIATKVLPTIDIKTLLGNAVGPNTALWLLQNGIDIEPPVRALYPENPLLSGLAFICVARIAPGVIHHQDYGRLVIGKYPSGKSGLAQAIADLLQSVRIDCRTTDNIIEARWKKLVWNAPFNPISVLGGGIDTRVMLGNPVSVTLIRGVMKEVQQLAAAEGVKLDDAVIEKNLTDTYKMTPYKTSMLLDYEAGRPMEVEAILGNAVRLAARHGVEVPYLTSLYALLTLKNEKNLTT